MAEKKYHKNLYLKLMLAILLILLLVPVMKDDQFGRFIIALLFLFVILRALSILSTSRRIFWVSVALGVTAGIGGPLLPLLKGLSHMI